MTDAQKKFCDEYLVDLNATRAYKVAYSSCKKDETASASASRLLRNVKIQEYIQEKQKEIQRRTEVTQDKVIRELAKIAFVDIAELYDKNGKLKHIKDIDSDIRSAIASLETLEEYEKCGEDREKIGNTQKVKLLDKIRALENLGKHLGMFKETNININTNYEEYLKRVEGNEY